MDLADDRMLESVRGAVAEIREAATPGLSASECFQRTRKALDQLQSSWPQRTRERVWLRVGPREELAKAAGLAERARFNSMSSAPSVELLSAGNDCSVLVSYHRSSSSRSTNDARVPVLDCVAVSAIASSRLRSELVQLLKRGYFHPQMRGLRKLFVNSESGVLSLSEWDLVEKLRDPDLAANRLQMLDFQIEKATVGKGAERRRERGYYAPSRHRVRRVFGRAPVLLPVIHPISHDTALASIKVCVEEGVDGIFLINQGMGDEEVMALVLEVRRLYPALWVGLNLLGSSPRQTLSTALAALEGSVDGLWVDNALVDERKESQDEANLFVAARNEFDWSGLYFGGVAFKYQREVTSANLAKVAALAAPVMDVVCTSGPGTAMAAEVDKVKAMRKGLGPFASLALASGVTIDNVDGFLPFVDAFLVGTGIESEFGVIDRKRVRELVRVIDARAFALPPIPSLDLDLDPIDEQVFKPIQSDLLSVLTETAERLEDANTLVLRAVSMGAKGRAMQRLRDSIHVSLRRALIDLAILAMRRYRADAREQLAAITKISKQVEEVVIQTGSNSKPNSSIRSLIAILSAAGPSAHRKGSEPDRGTSDPVAHAFQLHRDSQNAFEQAIANRRAGPVSNEGRAAFVSTHQAAKAAVATLINLVHKARLDHYKNPSASRALDFDKVINSLKQSDLGFGVLVAPSSEPGPAAGPGKVWAVTMSIERTLDTGQERDNGWVDVARVALTPDGRVVAHPLVADGHLYVEDAFGNAVGDQKLRPQDGYRYLKALSGYWNDYRKFTEPTKMPVKEALGQVLGSA